jgi:hypothetical protein
MVVVRERHGTSDNLLSLRATNVAKADYTERAQGYAETIFRWACLVGCEVVRERLGTRIIPIEMIFADAFWWSFDGRTMKLGVQERGVMEKYIIRLRNGGHFSGDLLT